MQNLLLEDIKATSLDEANRLMKQSQESFLKLFDYSPACMSLTTAGSRSYVKVNKRFVEIFGFTEEEILGRTSLEIGILTEDEACKVAQKLSRYGKIEHEVIVCRHKHGREVYTVSSIERVELNGQTYFMSSFLDISSLIEQQQIIERQHAEISDSINYARLIQNSILPNHLHIAEHLPESFVVFKPKAVVSGDFYYVKKRWNSVFIAAADCTGHGVPGAFMSMLGCEKLEEALLRSNSTSDTLRNLNQSVKNSLRQNDDTLSLRDGMDIALCSLNSGGGTMQFAGANRPLWIVRQGQKEIEEIKPTKRAIGGLTDNEQHFDAHDIKLHTGDTFYIFSDGYADTFGGPKGKKLTTRRFKELLLEIQELNMAQQKHLLESFVEEWKSGLEQVDDILVMGVRM